MIFTLNACISIYRAFTLILDWVYWVYDRKDTRVEEKTNDNN
jgi:hypothetical protein